MDIDNSKLSMRFSILVAIVFIMAVCAYLFWNMIMQNDLTRDKALAEARTLNLEMGAVWSYIDASQDAINYNADGSYDFKDIYCSIAGKNIAQRFTSQAEGYEIRFARENPRSGTDEPDRFEKDAIASFQDGGATEFFRIEQYEGKEVFRYASALEIRENCLACHGCPAGEKDETGYLKEGMAVGDLAGISSIVIPLGIYQREAQMRTTQGVVFFLALATVIIVVVRFALHRWVVGPLNKSNKKLHDENKAQSDFLAVMSHELRTPLSSIIAFTDVWERSAERRSDEEQRMVGGIKENSQVLLNMINNTIDAAKIEADCFNLTYEEVDLVDVIQSVTIMLGPLAFRNDIKLEKSVAPDTPIIVSDSEALRKVFMNIIGNAVKFSSRGDSVSIVVEGDGDFVNVSVKDTGPGIPASERKRIFERFARVENTEDAYAANGSGLGLFLAKTLVEKLGGSISFVSAIGEGSIFFVRLPAVAPMSEKWLHSAHTRRKASK